MARSPRPGGASRGVVKPPNEAGPGGNRASNSYVPLGGAAGPELACDRGGDRRRGCVPLGGVASPMHPPGHRFDVDDAKMPQPPSAVEPGKGAIPVNPREAVGRSGRAAPELEIAREPRR